MPDKCCTPEDVFPKFFTGWRISNALSNKNLLYCAQRLRPQRERKRERVRELTYTSALKIQHLSQKKLALRLLQYSFKIWPLSAINKGNQKKISKDEKPPVKHFLERENPKLVAFWPEAHFLHILRRILKLLKSKPDKTWYKDS